jgi:electron transfer flavoprotein beta subunit
MPYNLVVLVKQVPDTKRITGEAMRDDGTVNRSALPAIFNPEDLHALELALELREKHGGRVTVITMGPPQACDVLRESLQRGADDAVLLTDRRAAASDTLATSYILSCAVRKVGAEKPVDMVLCGRQAIDGDTAQVPPQTAEKLGWPQITYVESVELIGDCTLSSEGDSPSSQKREEGQSPYIRVKRSTGAGWERVECPLPCLLTVTDQAPEARPASAKRIMAIKKARSRVELQIQTGAAMQGAAPEAIAAEVQTKASALAAKALLLKQWTLDDIKADLQWCGKDGSPTKVKRIQSVVLKGSGFKKVEPNEKSVSEMVHALIEDHTIG